MLSVIGSFADKETRKLYERGSSRKFHAIEIVAKRKLDRIEAAEKLEDLLMPPGNRLEALKGDRSGQYSIRINDQYRICFSWSNNAAEDVEITDYH